jgi:hemerythrin superfamily protein
MNAIDLLTRQHRHVENLFDRFARLAGDDTAGRSELFAQIAEAIAVHTALEEDHLYPRVRDLRRADAQQEAYAEHQEVKEALSDLLQVDVTDPAFDGKLRSLRSCLELHVAGEETELFPALEQLLDDAELEELGMLMDDESRNRMQPWPDAVVPALDTTVH